MASFEYLMQVMDDPDAPAEQRVLLPRVIYRESTGSPNTP
jgi:hypothetical protein